MKSYLVAGLAALLCAGTASANDITWTGGYVGAQIGAGRILNDFQAPTWSGGGAHISPAFDGILGGIYGGYNYQLENGVVVGADLDFALSGIKGSATNFTNNAGGVYPNHVLDGNLTRSAAARVRLGYDAGQWLPYIAGGVAVGQYDIYVGDPSSHIDIDEDLTYLGWTIGAGVEYAVSSNVALRTEYRYTNFGRQTIRGADIDLQSHDVRVGLSYKF